MDQPPQSPQVEDVATTGTSLDVPEVSGEVHYRSAASSGRRYRVRAVKAATREDAIGRDERIRIAADPEEALRALLRPRRRR